MKPMMPRDFSTVGWFSMAAKGLQLVVTIMLVRLLSVADYAGYTVFFTVSSTVLGIAGQSVALAYVRYNTERLSARKGFHKDWLIVFAHVLNILCLIVLLFAAYPLVEIVGVSSLVILSAIVYGFLLGTVQLNMAFLQSRERYALSGVLDNAKQVSLLVVLPIAIVTFSGTLGSIVAAYCISGVASVAYSFFILRRWIVGHEISFHIDAGESRTFLSVSVWLILYGVTTQLFNQINVTMLSVFGNQIDVAEYGVASKYYSMILLLLPSIKTVLRVRMSKFEMTHSTDKQREASLHWIRTTFLPLGAGIAACIVGARFAFPILNGAQYNDAIIVFQILCVSAFVAYLLAPSSALIMSLNRYKTQFAISVVALSINLIGNYLLIPRMGASGTAVTTTISQIVLNLLMTVVVFRVGSSGDSAK